MERIQVLIVMLIIGVLLMAYCTFLFLQRKHKDNEFIASKYETNIGNAQLLGDNVYQNDYFTTVEKNNTLMAVISDGIGDKADGKYTSVMAVEVFKKNFKDYLGDCKSFFEKSIFQIKKLISDSVTNNTTGVRMITLIIKQNTIDLLSIGDCVAFIVRDRQIIYLNNIVDTNLLVKKTPLKNKDIVVMCTRGIFDNTTEQELIHRIDIKKHPQYKCESIIKLVDNKKKINAQNGTILILENIKS